MAKIKTIPIYLKLENSFYIFNNLRIISIVVFWHPELELENFVVYQNLVVTKKINIVTLFNSNSFKNSAP